MTDVTLVKRIGQGGFGVVDEVVTKKGEHLARKTFQINQLQTLTPDFQENIKKRFIREARVQAALDHANIVAVIESNLESNPPSFLMPLAVSTLSNEINQDRTLNGQFLNAIMDILSGLEELHNHSIYHRDLKPQNVLKFKDPEGDRYAISDFGLISLNDTQISVLTHTGMRMGSDCYTAPEIVKDLRHASPRSDIYSVGCILHDFVGSTDRVPCGEIRDDLGPYSDILLVCTRKDPNKRFGSVSDLRDAILSVQYQQNMAPAPNNDFAQILISSNQIEPQQLGAIAREIEKKFGSNELAILFNLLTIPKIEQMYDTDEFFADTVSNAYSDWVKKTDFNFGSCDGIAQRLTTIFTKTNSVDIKVDVLLALLYMGTSHNRWYVEQKFYGLCGKLLPNPVAARLSLEIRIDKIRACRAISHLMTSISVSLDGLHSQVAETFRKVCNI